MCSLKQNDEFYEHAEENGLEIDDVMSAEEADFLENNKEYDPDDPTDLGNRKESVIL